MLRVKTHSEVRMIKVISFDLWNTLITGTKSKSSESLRSIKLKESFMKYGYEFSLEEINSAIKKVWDYFNVEWLNRYYTLLTSMSVETIFRELKVNPNDKLKNEILEIMQKNLIQCDNRFIDGMKELVLELKDRYELAIISDSGFTPGRYLREVIRNLGMYDAFSLYAFSDEIGVSKPHRQIFEYVLKSLGAFPENSIHIGDISITDIKGANDMGIRSIYFHKEAYLFKDEEENRASFSTNSPEEILNYINGL